MVVCKAMPFLMTVFLKENSATFYKPPHQFIIIRNLHGAKRFHLNCAKYVAWK